jgi:hypothetical protein
MSIGSGIGGQVAIGAESSYGVYVAPTRALEFVSEGLDTQQPPIESQGIRAGSTVRRTSRWARNDKGAAGPIQFEVADKGFGLLFKHTLGAAAITTPVGATTARLHTHTLGDLDDLSLSIQKGAPDTSGVSRPFTFLGCVITQAELTLSVDGLLMFSPTVDARQMVTSETLVTPVFPSDDRVYGYQQAAITVAGVAETPTEFSLSIAHGLKTDRWYLSAAGTKGRPLINAIRELTGSLTFEFDSMTAVNRFLNAAPGTETSVAALLTGREIEAGHNFECGATTPKVRFDGGIPMISGPDVITVTQAFTVLDDATNPPITLAYKTTDTAS